MQVTSTLWPDIKSQKISERQSGSFGQSVAQEPHQNQSRQGKPQHSDKRRPKTARWKKMGAVGGPGRSTDLPGRPNWPVGLTASTSPHVTSSLVAQVGSASSHPWLLAINTRGGGRDYDTHTHPTLPLLSCISCIVFRLSGV